MDQPHEFTYQGRVAEHDGNFIIYTGIRPVNVDHQAVAQDWGVAHQEYLEKMRRIVEGTQGFSKRLRITMNGTARDQSAVITRIEEIEEEN